MKPSAAAVREVTSTTSPPSDALVGLASLLAGTLSDPVFAAELANLHRQILACDVDGSLTTPDLRSGDQTSAGDQTSGADTPRGEGWWQASDEKWYAPERQPGYRPPPPTSSPHRAGDPLVLLREGLPPRDLGCASGPDQLGHGRRQGIDRRGLRADRRGGMRLAARGVREHPRGILDLQDPDRKGLVLTA
jgi:hypothetical protein